MTTRFYAALRTYPLVKPLVYPLNANDLETAKREATHLLWAKGGSFGRYIEGYATLHERDPRLVESRSIAEVRI